MTGQLTVGGARRLAAAAGLPGDRAETRALCIVLDGGPPAAAVGPPPGALS